MRKESENCVTTGMKQITPYSKMVLVPQKVPKEDLKHKRKLSQSNEKAFP